MNALATENTGIEFDPMTGIEFDVENHVYRKGGVAFKSVTQWLTLAGVIDDRWFTEWSRDLGSAVHLAVQFYEEETLDWDCLDPRISDRLQLWINLKADMRLETLGVEERFVHPHLGYAGTMDWRGFDGPDYCLLDYKSGSWAKWHRLQLALYDLGAIADPERFGGPFDRLGNVYLKGDRAKVRWLTPEERTEGRRDAIALLNFYKIRKHYNPSLNS
jgi:hypothetical protein